MWKSCIFGTKQKNCKTNKNRAEWESSEKWRGGLCVSVLIYGFFHCHRHIVQSRLVHIASFSPFELVFDRWIMFSFVSHSIRRHCSIRIRCFQIKSVIFLVCLNICLKFSSIAAGPTSQQQQELLLLEALSKRQPSYYGTSNSIMDILGRSMYSAMNLLGLGGCVCMWGSDNLTRSVRQLQHFRRMHAQHAMPLHTKCNEDLVCVVVLWRRLHKIECSKWICICLIKYNLKWIICWP